MSCTEQNKRQKPLGKTEDRLCSGDNQWRWAHRVANLLMKSRCSQKAHVSVLNSGSNLHVTGCTLTSFYWHQLCLLNLLTSRVTLAPQHHVSMVGEWCEEMCSSGLCCLALPNTCLPSWNLFCKMFAAQVQFLLLFCSLLAVFMSCLCPKRAWEGVLLG